MTAGPPYLEEWLTLRALSRDELVQRVGASRPDVAEGVAYQGLRPVDRVQLPGERPAYAFFRGDELVMLYAGRGALKDISRASLEADLGDGHELRSRAGKRSLLHVYPDRGVAFSADGDEVEFLEVFPPTTLERYESEIYREPGPFVE